MKKYWKNISWKIINKNKTNFYESNLLKINSNKARMKLKWKCILNFKQMIYMVTIWYKNYYSKKENMYQVSLKQIREYDNLLKK